MFCSFCGAQNEAGSRFCRTCGRELNTIPSTTEGPNPSNMNIQTNQNIHNSIIRKSIKKDAKNRKKGTLIAGYFLFLVVIIAITLIISFSIVGVNIISSPGSQATMSGISETM